MRTLRTHTSDHRHALRRTATMPQGSGALREDPVATIPLTRAHARTHAHTHSHIRTVTHTHTHTHLIIFRHSEAEPLYRKVLELYEKTQGPEDPHTMSVLSNLAVCIKQGGRCVHCVGTIRTCTCIVCRQEAVQNVLTLHIAPLHNTHTHACTHAHTHTHTHTHTRMHAHTERAGALAGLYNTMNSRTSLQLQV